MYLTRENKETSSTASVEREADLDVLAAALVEQANNEGVELTGLDGFLTGLVQRVMQSALESEMTGHLGYERHDPAGKSAGNSRNGSYPRTARTDP